MNIETHTFDAIVSRVANHPLVVLGGFRTKASDDVPKGVRSVVLLGPGPAFWNVIKTSEEMKDGLQHPVDRWSTRVICGLAKEFGAKAVFPFGGPPYLPFYSWALRTGRIWSSPVKLAVHDTHGLFVSFRGALLFSNAIDFDAPPSNAPCVSCNDQPCLAACPVSALTETGYDVETCHDYLETENGKSCMEAGCRVRRSCPVGRGLRDPEQSAYHMMQFHRSEKL